MAAAQTKPTGNAHNFIEGTVTATDDAISLTGINKWGGISIQLTGTWTGTITFEANNQGGTSNWVALGLFPSATPTASVATTATANGAWGGLNQGWRSIRARFSTASSGTPTITITNVGSSL